MDWFPGRTIYERSSGCGFHLCTYDVRRYRDGAVRSSLSSVFIVFSRALHVVRVDTKLKQQNQSTHTTTAVVPLEKNKREQQQSIHIVLRINDTRNRVFKQHAHLNLRHGILRRSAQRTLTATATQRLGNSNYDRSQKKRKYWKGPLSSRPKVCACAGL